MSQNFKINIHVLYIINIILIIFLGLVVAILRGFTEINLVRYILFLNLLNNVSYILLNLKRIRLQGWTLLLFILVIISFAKGVIYNPISERVILDVYKPLSFIFIYQIFTAVSPDDRLLIMSKIKGVFAKILFRLSLVFGLTVVLLLIFFKGYPGLRLPLTIPITVYALNLKNIGVLSLIVAAVFSGKRAIIVASLPVLLNTVKKQLNFKKILIFLFSISVLLVLLYPKWDEINSSKAFNKYRYTIEKFKEYRETRDLEILNHASGQRVQEITSGFYEFNLTDYLFGKGVGYTYDLYNVKRTKLFKEDYGNIHFSPASLILTYGVFFTIIFYYGFFVLILKSKKAYKFSNAYNIRLLYFILVSIFIESLFAFVLFVLPFFPICLGLVSNYLKELKK